MNTAQIDLARKLVALPQWQWVDGMAACPWGDARSERVHIVATPSGPKPHWGANEKHWYDLPPTAWPDLTDYATAAILARVAVEAGAFPTMKLLLEMRDPKFDLGSVAAQAILAVRA